jgi:hypothetical protein
MQGITDEELEGSLVSMDIASFPWISKSWAT